MKRTAKIVIEAPWVDESILTMLCQRYTYHTEAEWRDVLMAGRILLNGRPVGAEAILNRGDVVEYMVPHIDEPEVDTGYRALYEDASILVVDKPPNLPCHPAGRFFNHTLWALLKRDLSLPVPHFISRLDRETSGLVLIAKDRNAAKSCRRQAERSGLGKEYLLIVEGTMTEALHARGWLLPDTNSAIRKKSRFVPDASGAPGPEGAITAETWFEPVQQYDGLTLVRARLGTGRTHQIRATIRAYGYPLVGDKLYGLDEHVFLRFVRRELSDADRTMMRLPRQALHASRLVFRHPMTGQNLDLSAALPSDLLALLASPYLSQWRV